MNSFPHSRRREGASLPNGCRSQCHAVHFGTLWSDIRPLTDLQAVQDASSLWQTDPFEILASECGVVQAVAVNTADGWPWVPSGVLVHPESVLLVCAPNKPYLSASEFPRILGTQEHHSGQFLKKKNFEQVRKRIFMRM